MKVLRVGRRGRVTVSIRSLPYRLTDGLTAGRPMDRPQADRWTGRKADSGMCVTTRLALRFPRYLNKQSFHNHMTYVPECCAQQDAAKNSSMTLTNQYICLH
jgi:hypothetical protein